MEFMNEMKKTQDMNTLVYTENGALGHKTTGKYLLDLNFSVSSLRNMKEADVASKFIAAFEEDPVLAMRWLFFARDVRGGMGERRLFRVCMKALAIRNSALVESLVPLVPIYGRWDDLWDLMYMTDGVRNAVVRVVKQQLAKDILAAKRNDSISLLAKWMPSVNTSSDKTRRMARDLANSLGLTERQYRKILSELRSKLNVTETMMSAKQWEDIDYESVPSRANLLYKDAFLRHDESRRNNYLESLQKGEKKINAATLFPHDVVHKYGWAPALDKTVEQLWNNLPDYVQGNGSTMVVADGSGSMCCNIGDTRVTAWEVAHSLAIYFAQHSKGPYKNQYITFSAFPKFVSLEGTTLLDNIRIARNHSEMTNTNIEAVFDLILDTAIRTNCKQEDIPQNILILSDMEFDTATRGGRGFASPSKTLFDTIRNKWENAGYKIPRLVFWNICSRTGAIPMKENDLGVALVSGFSPSVCKMVLTNELDPYKALLETIMNPRYDAIENAVKDIV